MPFKLIVLALMLLLGSCVSAQKFTSHAVKKGETLESLAKQYKVTPFNILKYNKEIKRNEVLKPNTILVIPLSANVSDALTVKTDTIEVEEKVAQKEPIGFTKHRVRKRETLFGLAERYRIEEEDIKRYNPVLYANQLKKGMRIKIPKYLRVAPTEEVVIDESNFETYIVKEKETRWSIAHTYGISIDSMLVLNPSLSKDSDYLAFNQELKLPKIAGSSVEMHDVQIYSSYTVPQGIGFYRLEKEYGVTADELIKLNPEITERGGLKEGMVIRIPEKKVEIAEVNTDNFIFYEVKPKENEFRLTRKLGVGYKELLELNPALRSGFKAGMVLKLPKNRADDFDIKNALIIDKVNLLDSINTSIKPKILFLLPFRLERLDLADTKSVRKLINSRTDIKYSLGFYSGAMIALDSIKSLGISVDVKTYDNQLSVAKTKEILVDADLYNLSAIIGPLDTASLKEVAVQAANFNVPVVSPLVSNTDLSLRNVFFSEPTETVLREKMLSFVEGKRDLENIIIIADRKNDSVRKLILERFPNAKILKVKEEEKNIAVNLEELTALFSEETENWVFLESSDFKFISSVSSILNSSISEEVKVKMYTTNKNKGFENDVISNLHLSNLNFTYPSAQREVSNSAFTKRYRKEYSIAPDKYAVRGFDITYDLLLKLAYKNDLFVASSVIGGVEYTGNKFNYDKDLSSGYFNIASYIMMYKNMRIKQLK
ncbi:MAG: LysM peptidoglycan-binding domain-containing protein [Cellulophaga sp.]